MIRSCLELFPDAPDGSLVSWEEVQSLNRHIKETFGAAFPLPANKEGMRILNVYGYRAHEGLFTARMVHYFPLQERAAMESLLAEKAKDYGFRVALISGVERPERQDAFCYAMREDVDMLVVDYEPAGLKDRSSLLNLLHVAAETGHAVIVIGPVIALD